MVVKARRSRARACRGSFRVLLLIIAITPVSVRTAADPTPLGQSAGEATYESIDDARLRSAIDAVWAATADRAAASDPDLTSRAPDLVERSGLLVQVTPIRAADGRMLEEWVVEQGEGSILVVATRASSTPPRLRSAVRLLGRFAGEIETKARDGRIRRWPLFLGRPVASASATGDPRLWIGGVVAVLAVALLVVRRRIRRNAPAFIGPGSRSRRVSRAGSGVGTTPEPMSLPSDPAEALGVLAAGRHDSEPFVMHRRRLEFEHASTTVLVGRGLLPKAGDLIAEAIDRGTEVRSFVAVDPGPEGVIEATHLPPLLTGLERLGETPTSRVEASELAKAMSGVESLWDRMLESGIDRRSVVVAMGGGIACDVVGYAASGWMRGVDLVLCPTTLLGMVDAAIGGKTGVNRRLPSGGLGKNLVGAFWPARLVICDCDTLRTLGDREFRSGLAECVKHAIIDGSDALASLERELPDVLGRDPDVLSRFIDRSAGVKIGIVERDPREAGERALLNLGHTYAHALESRTDLGLVHGEAVAIGLVAACRASVAAGLRSESSMEDRIRAVLGAAGLPTGVSGVGSGDLDGLMAAMRVDKKASHGRIRLVLPRDVGDVVVVEDPGDAVVRAGWDAVIDDR